MKPDLSLSGSDRIRDALDLAPPFTEHDAVRLNRMFRGPSTLEMLIGVIRDKLAVHRVVAPSVGAGCGRGLWRHSRSSDAFGVRGGVHSYIQSDP